MKLLMKNDSGVSPVIGTILLVAITVVLVAIIAAVVMGMVGGVSSTKDVGMTITPYYTETDGTGHENTGHGVIVLIYGGNDANKLTDLNVNVEGVASEHIKKPTDLNDAPQVGVPYRFEVTAGVTNQLVTVTGNFSDGTTAVIMQDSVTLQFVNYV